jgi:transcriptional repressor AefR-like protein
MRPDVLLLRRLVLGEVGRFPDLARSYYERVPGRVLDGLAELFAELAAKGRMRSTTRPSGLNISRDSRSGSHSTVGCSIQSTRPLRTWT